MTDQSKPAEIEDVLSSIRRLVAGGASGASRVPQAADPAESGAELSTPEDGDGAGAAAGADAGADETDHGTAPPDDAAPEAPAALILTPALRIAGTGAQNEGDTATPASDGVAAEEATSGHDEADVALGHGAADADRADLADPVEYVDPGDEVGPADAADPGGERDRPDPAEAAPEEGPDALAPGAGDDAGIARFDAPAPAQGDAGGAGGEQSGDTDAAAAGAAPRHGFGFGAVRGDDPTRHVPLARRPVSPAADASPSTGHGADDTAASASEPAAPPADSATGDRPAARPPMDPHAPPRSPAARHPCEAGGSASGAHDDAMREIESGLSEGGEDQGLHGPIISPDFARRQSRTSLPQAHATPPDTEDHDPRQGAEEADRAADAATPPPPAAAQGMAIDAASAADQGADPTAKANAGAEAVQGAEAGHDTGAPAGESGMKADESPPAPVQHDAAPEGVVRPDDPAAGGGTAPLNLFGDAESGIDEAALRSLVADVVQRELQGALGERVSRNIRALVRREIARALEARDLE